MIITEYTDFFEFKTDTCIFSDALYIIISSHNMYAP